MRLRALGFRSQAWEDGRAAAARLIVRETSVGLAPPLAVVEAQAPARLPESRGRQHRGTGPAAHSRAPLVSGGASTSAVGARGARAET